MWDRKEWEQARQQAEHETAADRMAYNDQVVQWQLTCQEAKAKWDAERRAYEAEREKHNSGIDQMREAYLRADSGTVQSYCLAVLIQGKATVYGARFGLLGYVQCRDENTGSGIYAAFPEGYARSEGNEYVQARDSFHGRGAFPRAIHKPTLRRFTVPSHCEWSTR